MEANDDSQPPSPKLTSPIINPRSGISRQTSQWSEHHNAGTSYFPGSPQAARRPSSPKRTTSHRFRSSSSTSVRRSAVRSASLTSNRRHLGGRGALSEEAEQEGEPENQNGDSTEDDNFDQDAAPTPRLRDQLYDEEDPVTLRDRQSLINDEHPFGLPIWKPALYKKSRTVTRNAETALHAVPSAAAERVLLPGNVLWTILFGWWLALQCMVAAVILAIIPFGGNRYASLVYGLGWYLFWPFGKYVEGDEEASPDKPVADDDADSFRESARARTASSSSHNSASAATVRGARSPPQPLTNTILPSESSTGQSTIKPRAPDPAIHIQSDSWNSDDRTPLLHSTDSQRTASYGALRPSHTYGVRKRKEGDLKQGHWLGKAVYWFFLVCNIAPLMLLACAICWGLVITIPMAKLNWELIKHLFTHPSKIRFCSAPALEVPNVPREADENGAGDGGVEPAIISEPGFTIKRAKLQAGQVAPSGKPDSTVLLCVYRAVGWQYYKYTVGGVNIFFINLLPIVFFVIFDGLVLLEYVEKRHHKHQHVPPYLAFIASRGFIFLLSLASVIPLSYFIGMAVASISAQSSIGMGAVINATFGSIIEIILYAIALTEGKGRLVEGSIVGSILAGVLLMPGASMCSSALRRKEQRFNAKSAGVTSTMLIMAIFGALTPTLFYQTYGNFELICDGCPPLHQGALPTDVPWICKRCYYSLPNPVTDPFYQHTVKPLMYFCAGILVFSYLIGLWFSLRTHASQIWQNPSKVMNPMDLQLANPGRMSLYHKILNLPRRPESLRRKPSIATTVGSGTAATAPAPPATHPIHFALPPSPTHTRRNPILDASHQSIAPRGAYTPLIEHVAQATKGAVEPIHLPPTMTTDEFTRAVAVATVSALRHQAEPVRAQPEHEHQGGHDAPAWSRTVSASVLMSCTLLYAIIAEILVNVVDVVLEGSGIDEKFLGITLFALVPNTTEFMNAMSFAINGNISLSMEIGSAYALQVCLLQIPAMVAFSAWYDPRHMGTGADTFTLVFPRWDAIAIILSIFLLTYTYIEAKSNYHRGSILVLSYLVMAAGFYAAPVLPKDHDAFTPSSFTTQSLSLFMKLQALFFSIFTR